MRKNKKNPLCSSSCITCRPSGNGCICHNLSNYVVKFLLTISKIGSKINLQIKKRQKGQTMIYIIISLLLILIILFISYYLVLRNFISYICAKHILKKLLDK